MQGAIIVYSRFEHDPALALHGLNGVHHQVDYHLLEFIRVSVNKRDLGEQGIELHGFALQLKTQQLQNFVNQVIEIDDTIQCTAVAGK